MRIRQYQSMATSKQKLWTIETRRRTWILTSRQLALKVIVGTTCTLCVLTVLYSVFLIISVRSSNHLQARIAFTENTYMEKNWRELERGRQILLLAGESYAKRLGNPIDRSEMATTGADFEKEFRRVLREPYPDSEEVERLLGKADRQYLKEGRDVRIWQRTIWKKPAGWPSDSAAQKSWPNSLETMLEAWFDKDGYLIRLFCSRETPEGVQIVEQIGRLASDWKIQRSETQVK